MDRPDYHDPTAGIGGAPPAQSALTLRLLLALFGLAACAALTIVCVELGAPVVLSAIVAFLALAAAVDVAVILRRKFAGEPG